jgi:hypothetical protein
MSMSAVSRITIAFVAGACGLAATAADITPETHGPGDLARVEAMARDLAGELSRACPIARPNDEKALGACKQAMYAGTALRAKLSEFVLWGRMQSATATLKETNLTQFGQDVFTRTYLPLFMFTGEYQVAFEPRERQHRIDFTVAFRNRLQPGMFPYPFWHDENKWSIYQGANRITMWVALDKKAAAERITAIQFSVLGRNHAGVPSPIATPVFEKETHAKWVWLDSAGRTQPQVTLFDALFRPGNPYLARLDSTYRAMALELRDHECTACHQPTNPQRMKRLVLLTTPAHAASEVGRVIDAARRGSMPLDDAGIEHPMKGFELATFLSKAEAFQAALEEAKRWETGRAAR